MSKTILRSQSPTPFQGGYIETTVYPDNFTIKYFDKESAEYAKNTFNNIQYGDRVNINGTDWVVKELEEAVDLINLFTSGKDLGVAVGYLEIFNPYE